MEATGDVKIVKDGMKHVKGVIEVDAQNVLKGSGKQILLELDVYNHGGEYC